MPLRTPSALFFSFVFGCILLGRPLALHAEDTLPALLRRTQEGSPQERRDALEEIEKMGVFAYSAIPFLVKALDDRDTSVVAAATRTLGKMGRHARPALPALIKTLHYKSFLGRFFTRFDSTRWRRFYAAQALRDILKSVRVWTMPPTLTPQAKKERDAVRKLLLPALESALHDAFVFDVVLEALTHIGRDAHPAFQRSFTNRRPIYQKITILQKLRTMHKHQRPHAKELLHAFLPLLLPLPKHPDPNLRLEALHLLALSKDHHKKALQGFIETLQAPSSSASLRRSILYHLEQLGSRALPALTTLLHALHNPKRPLEEQQMILRALPQIDDKEGTSIHSLAHFLQHPQKTLRESAIFSIQKLPQHTEKIFLPLLNRLLSNDPFLTQTTIRILLDLRYTPKRSRLALPYLLDAFLRAPADQRDRYLPLFQRLKLDLASKEDAIRKLKDAMQQDPSLHSEATRILQHLEPKAHPSLVDLLQRHLPASRPASLAVYSPSAPSQQMPSPAEIQRQFLEAKRRFDERKRLARNAQTPRATKASANSRAFQPSPADIAKWKQQLNHKAPLIRLLAAHRLARYGHTKESLPLLRRALQQKETRPLLLENLHQIGAAASPLLPDLLSLLQRPSLHKAHQISSVLRTLGRIAKLTPEIQPILLLALDHHEGVVRLAALVALIRCGENHYLPSLLALLDHQYDTTSHLTRLQAASALLRLKHHLLPVLPKLRIHLKNHPDPHIRQTLIFAIQPLKQHALTALPELQYLAQHDPHHFVRSAARHAIATLKRQDGSPSR